MAIYFVGDYPKLKDSLLESGILIHKNNGISDSLSSIKLEMNEISTLIDELKGNYSESLSASVEQLLDEITNTYNTINEGLSGVIENLTGLSAELIDFENIDNMLEKIQSELKSNELSYNSIDSDDERNKVKIDFYRKKIVDLKNKKNDITDKIFEVRNSCDKRIQAIKNFNNDITQIRLGITSVTNSLE